MPLRDLQLLRGRIALELNHLHTVQQRPRNGLRGVCRADEHDVRKIIGHIHVMIRKGLVLLRIQHLQKRCARVSVIGAGQLVHLIQHHHRIGHAGLLNAVQNTSRHRAQVGSPVSPDVCLVPHTAQAHPDILPSQGLRDGFADAGFAGTRRTHEEKDGARLGLLQVHHRNLLNDPVLHLPEGKMILIQDLFCLIQIDFLRLRLLPVQLRHELQVIIEHAGLLAAHALLLQTVQKLGGLCLRQGIHAGLPDLLLKALDVRLLLRMHLIQLLLHVADLLLERLLPHHPLVILLLPGPGISGDLRHFDVLIENVLQHIRPDGHTVFLQYRIALLIGNGQPGRENGCHLLDRAVLIDHGPHEGAAPEASGQILQLTLQLLQTDVGLLRVLVFNVVELRGTHVNTAPVLRDMDFLHIGPVCGMDHHIALRIDFCHLALQGNGIEAAFGDLVALRLLLQGHQQHRIILLYIRSRQGTEGLGLEIYIGMRQCHHIVNGYYGHVLPPLY